MKLRYLPFLILLFPTSFFAQDYIPLVVEDKHWIFEKCGTLGDESAELFEHLIRGDTMIEGQAYKKMYKRSFDISWSGNSCDFIDGENPQTPPYTIIDTDYIGAIREDASKKVFFKPVLYFSPCIPDNEEHLLFDFAPEIEDTTLVCASFDFIGIPDTLFVSEFTIESFHGERNTIKYQKEGVNGELFYSLYEGIGSRLGIIQHWSLIYQLEDGYYSIRDICEGTDEECLYTNTAVNNILPTASVKISPSPSNGNFTLQLEREISQNTSLQIMSSQGSLILEQSINNPTVNVNADLPTGLYFLSIIEEGRQIWSGKTIVKD